MRRYPRTRKLLLASPILAFTFSAITPPVTALADKEKLKPEELVAKHLESIGPAEARTAARSRIITGTAVASFRMGGHGQAQGKALLASQGPKSLITMVFGLVDYPHEKIAYDGQKVTVGQVRPGVRTLLGRFLATNGLAFREGLAGGTLSAAWPLLDLTSRNAKLQYEGLKRIEKRELHAIKYSAPKSSDLKVTLFFEQETFQHVRTEYHQTIETPIAANKPGESAGQEETRIDLVEEFSDFRTESKLMLPHTYKLQFTINGRSGSVLTDWLVTLTQFEFAQIINEKEFNLEAN